MQYIIKDNLDYFYLSVFFKFFFKCFFNSFSFEAFENNEDLNKFLRFNNSFASFVIDFIITKSNYKRANGIEPSSLDWKSKVITIIRRPHYYKFDYLMH